MTDREVSEEVVLKLNLRRVSKFTRDSGSEGHLRLRKHIIRESRNKIVHLENTNSLVSRTTE